MKISAETSGASSPKPAPTGQRRRLSRFCGWQICLCPVAFLVGAVWPIPAHSSDLMKSAVANPGIAIDGKFATKSRDVGIIKNVIIRSKQILSLGRPIIFEIGHKIPDVSLWNVWMLRHVDGFQINKSALISAQSLIGFPEYVRSSASDYSQNNSEATEDARPPRQHRFISYALGFSFFGLSLALMVVAFKSAEYLDDCGLWWGWWIPLLGFAGLSVWSVAHGIDLLSSADRHSEDVRVLAIVVPELQSVYDAAFQERPEASNGLAVENSG
jgi:hypothetical protein